MSPLLTKSKKFLRVRISVKGSPGESDLAIYPTLVQPTPQLRKFNLLLPRLDQSDIKQSHLGMPLSRRSFKKADRKALGTCQVLRANGRIEFSI